jgi:hypothetical protein
MMLADEKAINWDLWDICELLTVLLVIAYLRGAEHDEFRPLITGLLGAFVFMTVIAHIFS